MYLTASTAIIALAIWILLERRIKNKKGSFAKKVFLALLIPVLMSFYYEVRNMAPHALRASGITSASHNK